MSNSAWHSWWLVEFDLGAPAISRNTEKKERHEDYGIWITQRLVPPRIYIRVFCRKFLLLSFEGFLEVDESLSTQRIGSQRAGVCACIKL